jgi:hypothetical protein
VRLVGHLEHRRRPPVTGPTRAERLAAPPVREALRQVTADRGGCIRPAQLRRTDTSTGERTSVLVPCGSVLEAICPACARRARTLRATQCREGWHLEAEPGLSPAPPDEDQAMWLTLRAEAQVRRDAAADAGEDTADLDAVIEELDAELTAAGLRGTLTRTTGQASSGGDGQDQAAKSRRSRSTRRRQDAPDLPRRQVSARTTGKVYRAPDGRTYRPSMFLTLTCDSYGRVRDDGTPVNPDSYDYHRAARNAIHFPALFDRLIQNLRRYLGYDVQYFATIEPQRRLAPHAHIAFRGAISRNDLRKVLAATYHQVWWPSTDTVRFGPDQLPEWHEPTGRYVDPATGEVLPSWDEALDAIGPADEPLHVARFGPTFDAQGVLAGTPDSARCIAYLTKYLTKAIAGCHTNGTDAEREHAQRLTDALRYEPCSPSCANWLRYGVTPKNAKAGMVPGLCKGKAHRPENLGYAGRRVLVSRKWSGKTLADHRADRKAWLLDTLGLPDPATSPGRYRWEYVTPADPDHMPPTRRLLHVLADRTSQQAALDQARRKAAEATGDPPATGRAA